ncbi:MAG: protein-glutamate O-methyltransferase CheR [Spirochaetales bacterium]|nr:protein-glutamate O-methyltransferase CheR [Spirochaetales bacterium]
MTAEAELTLEEFQRFADFAYIQASISIKPTKVTLLSNRLRKRVQALELASFEEYYEYLMNHGKEEISRFLEVITTNETYFWRTIQNYELIKKYLVADLLKQGRLPLKFWSAGCSTGEEPYNLAMELTESMKQHGVFSFEIDASDISERVVHVAREGRYNGRKIEKVPPLILRRYFREEPEKPGYFRVRDDIKEKVRFRVENLFTARRPSAYDCILCRNVMIYFQRVDQEVLIQTFHQNLRPGGFLIIGHSESLHLMRHSFEYVSYPEGVVYRKNA